MKKIQLIYSDQLSTTPNLANNFDSKPSMYLSTYIHRCYEQAVESEAH